MNHPLYKSTLGDDPSLKEIAKDPWVTTAATVSADKNSFA